ncbi:ribonuclease H-like domain-containing protein [Tanacetum coccineum]
MTASDNTLLPTPLSEKLSLFTHHHLLTRVPVKLDLDNWNFRSWEFFFEELCASYEVDKYLRSPINETSASSLAPLTPEETKVDKIVLSLILFTLFDSLCARIVVVCPKSAKEAWSLISDIVKDNKRSRTNTLKAELRSIKLGDQSMESYFQKIDSIVNILTSLEARVNEEDVDTFPDLKEVRSLLIAEEMRLESKVLALPVDSSSPMVLVAETSTNSRPSTSQGKSWKPCFNFAKGSCRFGDSCRYVHDTNARVSNANSGFNKGRGTCENMTNDLLTKLLAQLGHLGMNVAMSNNGTNVTLPTHATVTPTVTGPNIASNVPTAPHAFNASLGTLHDPTTGAWNMDTCASSHLNNSVTSLSTIINSCMYSTVSVGDGHSIPVINTGHNILSTPLKSLRLNNVLITPHIDFMTRRVLLRCDSTKDLYPVTAPSPIPSAFLVSQQTWHQRLGHPGREVMRRLCDHGGEFDNRKLHDLFNTNGIQFRFSCPKTSQQNGKSERMVHTINNLIRTLPFQANLPPTFWVEALNMVVHLLNILPSTTIGNEIPFTRLFGTQPDYSLLRTFGCLCYPHLYPTHKLEPRATPSIFLGHASSHRGYRCLDLTTNKIILSRHVTFDETVFPYGSTKPAMVPSYTFLDEPDIPTSSVSVSKPSLTVTVTPNQTTLTNDEAQLPSPTTPCHHIPNNDAAQISPQAAH